MKSDIILAKIESLRRCIRRVEEKRPDDVNILKEDYDIQDIVSVNLERAVQISVDIAAFILAECEKRAPATMAESFEKLKEEGVISSELAEKLIKAVGFRNISVHECQSIDWDIVFSIIHRNLPEFKKYIKAVLDYLDE